MQEDENVVSEEVVESTESNDTVIEEVANEVAEDLIEESTTHADEVGTEAEADVATTDEEVAA
jgi:hypothetical protein